MHLDAHSTSLFRLILGLPMIFGFIFGFVRDSWNPMGRGDKGHLLLFAGATAATYGVMTFLPPSYGVLLGGVFCATVFFQMTNSVATGLTTILGQDNDQAGGMASASLVASYLPQGLGFLSGGWLSGMLEGQAADKAAHSLFLVAALLMVVLMIVGVFGPRAVYAAAERARTRNPVLHDLRRLARHWPIYPVMMMQLLWQFSPSTSTVLQYHLANTLHGTDEQWGEWNALFISAFVPGLILYAWLCRRVALKWLLIGGFGVAVFQMTPFLVIKTANGALIAAVAIGFLGAIAQGSLTDLLIRSSPRGLEGTTFMLFFACYWLAFRVGDLFGTTLYDHFGFITPVVATMISTALVLPVLLLVPKRLIATRDGEPLASV
jgi:Na+/melibiose symporter-like transporter